MLENGRRGEGNECSKGQGRNRKGMFNKITNEKATSNELTIKHVTKFLTMVNYSMVEQLTELSLGTRKDS